MSRSGYSDDCGEWALIRWRGAVTSAMRGKRGQAFLRELLAAMDAMPEKKLIANDLEVSGQVCALGCVGRARGMDMSEIDPEDNCQVSNAFGVARAMSAEIQFMNDEWFYNPKEETPEGRFLRMRNWIAANIAPEPKP